MEQEVLNKAIEEYYKKNKPKKKTEFSKLIVIICGLVYFVVVLVCLFAWYLYKDIPNEILTNATATFTGIGLAYQGKSGLENKAKIQEGYDPYFDKKDGEM